MILRLVRLGLAGLCLLLGSALLMFGATSWRTPPAFFSPRDVTPASWAAFCVGMSAVGLGLIVFAAFGMWRTRGFSRTSVPMPRAEGFMQARIRAPRYVVDVAACLAVAILLLSVPVLFVGGAPQVLLAPFWTTLVVIGLAGGGVLGALRR